MSVENTIPYISIYEFISTRGFTDENAFTVGIVVNNQNYHICDVQSVSNILEHSYSYWKCRDFDRGFTAYFNDIKNDLKRLYSAWLKDYDITENYDKYSEIKRNSADTYTTTENGYNGDSVKSETSVSTFESDLKDVTTITNSGTIRTTNSYDKSTDLDSTIEHTHGNVGVTTNAQMIENELKVRTINILRKYINSYILENCFYTGGDE